MTHTTVDLLLTRGENCSDKEMVKAIGRIETNLFSNDYAMQKLGQIASTETPEARLSALAILAKQRSKRAMVMLFDRTHLNRLLWEMDVVS